MKITFTLIFLIFCRYLFAQKEVEEYITNHTFKISNIDTNSRNYDDLKPIGDAIGNARIVMLGEGDHGDASAFMAKTRLVKYLHEKKGFNVLAFESDFYSLTKGWDALQKEKGIIDSFLRQNIYGIWSECDACRHLFYTYIPQSFKTSKPMHVTGFDNQLLSRYSSKNLSQELDSILKAIGIENPAISHSVDTLISSYRNYNGEKKAFYQEIEPKLLTLKSIIEKKVLNNVYWLNIIKSLIALNWRAIHSPENGYDIFNIERDKQMAENLKWLVNNKYKNEKIIVWAANAHIINYSGKLIGEKSHLYNFKSMGNFFMADKNVPETYILGFTSFSGYSKWANSKRTHTISPPKKNSLEAWIQKDIDYGFIDFKKYNLEEKTLQPFYMKPGLFSKSLKSDWNKAFDGIFFIRNTYGCNTVR